jgi:hypothetical protein
MVRRNHALRGQNMHTECEKNKLLHNLVGSMCPAVQAPEKPTK